MSQHMHGRTKRSYKIPQSVTQSVNVGNGIDKAPAEPRLQGGHVF